MVKLPEENVVILCNTLLLHLLKKDMDVNEHNRLSNIMLRHKLKNRNGDCIAILHFTITVSSSTLNITHTLK